MNFFQNFKPHMISRKIIISVLLCVVGLILFDKLMSWTVYNPAIATSAYRWLTDRHLLSLIPDGEEKNIYPTTTIGTLNNNMFWKPRAAVVGTVIDELRASDGDWHINVQDEHGDILVVEMIPEYPLSLPNIGSKIKIWGITRFDLEHRWWELHPVIGWAQL